MTVAESSEKMTSPTPRLLSAKKVTLIYVMLSHIYFFDMLGKELRFVIARQTIGVSHTALTAILPATRAGSAVVLQCQKFTTVARNELHKYVRGSPQW